MQNAATQRRLAAILAADVVGFSRMMGADEEGTLARLKKVREEVTDPAIAEFRGRIFKTTGDGLLVEFPSVVDAVQCASKVQIDMARRNKSSAPDQSVAGPAAGPLIFRVGINLGDVIVEEDDLYGDGVNVAARLEGICDPGGVAISASAYDQVRGKTALAFVDRGEHRVKNIARPVHVYALDLRGHGVVFRKKVTVRMKRLAIAALVLVLLLPIGLYFLKKKPPEAAATIAVLPFANQSGDAKREYFSDGITEDIINALGRFSGVRVAARNAVQAYKGKDASPQDISSDLGVRYLVHGSVREAGGKVRVGVELSDATKGTVLWSDRYDGEGKDVFEIQDRIVRNVVGTLAVKVNALEEQRIGSKPPERMEAYDLVLRARELLSLRSGDRVTNRQARAFLQQALELSPGYAEAYAALAHAELRRAFFGWVEDPAEAVKRSEDAARRAIATGDAGASARALGVLANLHTFTGDFDGALREAERAIELNPSDAFAHSLRGGALLWTGRIAESIAASETARRFDPRFPSDAAFNLAMAYYLAGRYRDALGTVNGALAAEPDLVFLQAVRAASAAQLGESAEAKDAAQAVRRFDPFFQVESFGNRLVEAPQRAKAQEGLKKAGL